MSWLIGKLVYLACIGGLVWLLVNYWTITIIIICMLFLVSAFAWHDVQGVPHVIETPKTRSRKPKASKRSNKISNWGYNQKGVDFIIGRRRR